MNGDPVTGDIAFLVQLFFAHFLTLAPWYERERSRSYGTLTAEAREPYRKEPVYAREK